MTAQGTEARVCADIANRQQAGIAKYGTTVSENPLGLVQWLQHAYEEALDQAVYLKRAIEQLEGVPKAVDLPTIQPEITSDNSSRTERMFVTMGGGFNGEPIAHGMAEVRFDAVGCIVGIGPVEVAPTDPHAELRKTWRPGHRQQFYDDGAWHELVHDPVRPDCRNCRHPDDKDGSAE